MTRFLGSASVITALIVAAATHKPVQMPDTRPRPFALPTAEVPVDDDTRAALEDEMRRIEAETWMLQHSGDPDSRFL